MVQKVQVTFVDDLDGTVASGTTSFALDGKDYEIDLSDSNADKLRSALAPFIAPARRAGGSRRGSSPGRSSTGRSREETQAMRDWLRSNGYTVKDRGRIPSELEQAYENRTPAKSNTSPNVVGFKAATG
jgi:hypothetical protein